jgi:hypothetical protein
VEHGLAGGGQSGAAIVTLVEAAPAAQWPFPSHAPPLHGVPATANAQIPEVGLHWLETHSVPPHFGVPTQPPAVHVSEPAKTQRLPSEHAVPSGAAGFEQVPLRGSHVPATWQTPGAPHVVVAPAVHVPATQVSFVSQALTSLHDVPSVAGGFEHWPVDVSHVPATWHWSEAVHVTGLAPVQMPLWQLSVWVQAFPSLHDVPFAAAGFEH